VHAVHRAARQTRPIYTALCQRVRGSPVVTPDETRWKVAGRLHWLWAVATPDTTVYRIQAGRGYPEAARLLGRRFTGIIVRDGWRRIGALTARCIRRVWRICFGGRGSCTPITRAPASALPSARCYSRHWRFVIAISQDKCPLTASPWPVGGGSSDSIGSSIILARSPQQILASVLRTAHQRQLDVQAMLVSLLHSRTPTVVRGLQNNRAR